MSARPDRLLAIYLNDHLAGATIGRDLARRTAQANQDQEYGRALAVLAEEIDEDRESLLALMRAIGVTVDRAKVLIGAAAERLARLKLNGQLTGYSPLSRVVELEGLAMGVRGKLAMWTALVQVSETRPQLSAVDLPDLIARAQHQHERIEELRLRAVEEALRR